MRPSVKKHDCQPAHRMQVSHVSCGTSLPHVGPELHKKALLMHVLIDRISKKMGFGGVRKNITLSKSASCYFD